MADEQWAKGTRLGEEWSFDDVLRPGVQCTGRPLPSPAGPALRNSTAHAARDPDSDSAHAFSDLLAKERRGLIGRCAGRRDGRLCCANPDRDGGILCQPSTGTETWLRPQTTAP